MSARSKSKYPPVPTPLGPVDKFTVWAIYRGAWFGIRSFGSLEEAEHFAAAVVHGATLITKERHVYECTVVAITE